MVEGCVPYGGYRMYNLKKKISKKVLVVLMSATFKGFYQ